MESTLAKWQEDRISAGQLRKWLQENVWQSYGQGLWAESWSLFMREFAGAVQPYAHYGRSLSQWQMGSISFVNAPENSSELTAIMSLRPRAYDAQKATRITLFHALIAYVLGRIWIGLVGGDVQFAALIKRFGKALGQSNYLDGHSTNWSQQFWALLWWQDGSTILE